MAANTMKAIDNVRYYHTSKYSSMQKISNKNKKMHGVKRVIVFCIMIAILPATLIIIPLYLRNSLYAAVNYQLTESDIIEIQRGISSIFCERQTLAMNSSFNAFQLNNIPEISKTRKHIRLKKSMSLPDDTLEYWGFYLLKGATVALKVCSRYEGSRILVVKGERNLQTCGLMEHNQNKVGAEFNQHAGEVRVKFESVSEIISPNQGGVDDLIKGADKADESQFNHGGEVVDEEFDIFKLKSFKSKHSSTAHQVVDVTEKSSTPSTAKLGQLKEKTENHTNKTSHHKHHAVNSTHSSSGKHNDTKSHGKEHKGVTASELSEITLSQTTESVPKIRHHRKKDKTTKHPHKAIDNEYTETDGEQMPETLDRQRRDLLLDRRVNHGGNAFNFTDNTSDSVSSFENSLLTCYAGQILLASGFPPSEHCNDVQFLENGVHMTTKHEVIADGYYYYIFYSDNDLKVNDIHAVFDIRKPTFQYSNISESKGCINSTSCSFPIKFWGPHETVIVEVNVRDGIEHEEDDITQLISTCHPRMAVYIIFPISVLLLILGCAFI